MWVVVGAVAVVVALVTMTLVITIVVALVTMTLVTVAMTMPLAARDRLEHGWRALLD